MSDRRQTSETPDRVSRVLGVISRISGRGGQRSELVERGLLVAAILIFAVATVTSWQRAPIALAQFRPGLVVVAGMLAVLALLANALEFALSARLLGLRTPRDEAVRVSVLSSAANVLPIPGAVLIRTRALRQSGEGLRGAAAVTTGVGIAWVAAAGVLAGALMLSVPSSRALGMFILGGALLAVAFSILIVTFGAGRPSARWLAELAIIEFTSVVLSGLRLFVVALAVGFEVDVIEAMAINFGGILSHAAGVFPGGLGIKELLSGVFATLVGIDTSVGILMAALDRMLSYLVLGAVIVVLLGRAPELRALFKRGTGGTT